MCSPQPVPSAQPLPAHVSEAGFTLVELLVTVLIVGVLAVIGLPAYLNQVTKAKQSEAKTTLSSIVRAQTLFRSEFNQFASSIERLPLGLPPETANYRYAVLSTVGFADYAGITATAKDTAIKGYSAATQWYTQLITTPNNGTTLQQQVISSVLCEAEAPGVSGSTPPLAGQPPTCPPGYITLPTL